MVGQWQGDILRQTSDNEADAAKREGQRFEHRDHATKVPRGGGGRRRVGRAGRHPGQHHGLPVDQAHLGNRHARPGGLSHHSPRLMLLGPGFASFSPALLCGRAAAQRDTAVEGIRTASLVGVGRYPVVAVGRYAVVRLARLLHRIHVDDSRVEVA